MIILLGGVYYLGVNEYSEFKLSVKMYAGSLGNQMNRVPIITTTLTIKVQILCSLAS
jgi:hypothetical protein